MSLAMDTDYLVIIDANWILKDTIQALERSQASHRFHVYRLCIHTTVIYNDLTVERMLSKLSQEADPYAPSLSDVQDHDEVEDCHVFDHLEQLAAMKMSNYEVSLENDRTNAIATLTASAHLPTICASVQGQSLSSFRRHSRREIVFAGCHPSCYEDLVFDSTNYRNFVNTALRCTTSGCFTGSGWNIMPLLAWVGCPKCWPLMLYQIRFDMVDLFSWILTPTWRPGIKRRRGPLYPILQESPGGGEDTSQVDHAPEPKRSSCNGVRHRPDRKIWMAEIRQGQNKVWIGEFKSEVEAAPAADAPHYRFGRTDLLNFPDTPQLLSGRPTPAELNEEDKLKFVKEQAKWLAFMASTLPSTSTSPSTRAPNAVAPASSEIPESSRGRTAVTLEFRSFSEISSLLSYDNFDEADDGVSQLQPGCLHPDPMADSVANGIDETMEPNFAAADVDMGATNKFQMLENFLLGPPSPAPMFQVENPLDLQGDVAESLEQQIRELWRFDA